MRIISTFFSYFIILLATLLLPWWAVVLGMIVYLLRYPGWGLPFMMLVVDVYYGVLWSTPWLTLSAVVLVVAMTYFRPLLWGRGLYQ